MSASREKRFDYDYIIVGSGFGGSVSALRLAEKGYRVCVIERGKWFTSEKDIPRSPWNLRKYLWAPAFSCYGFQAFTVLRHAFIFHGTAVGGGSVVYAANNIQPDDETLDSDLWNHLEDWKVALKPKFDLARKMLGSTLCPQTFASDAMLGEIVRELGGDGKITQNACGIFFGPSDNVTPDPYFNGNGPPRTGCNFCAACTSGCRSGAKNTLDKNYLYLARKFGATILAEHEVVQVKPDGTQDGSSGYRVEARQLTGVSRARTVFRAQGVVLSGGVLGTIPLLFRMRDQGHLADLSPTLGTMVRTNSETIVTAAFA